MVSGNVNCKYIILKLPSKYQPIWAYLVTRLLKKMWLVIKILTFVFYNLLIIFYNIFRCRYCTMQCIYRANQCPAQYTKLQHTSVSIPRHLPVNTDFLHLQPYIPSSTSRFENVPCYCRTYFYPVQDSNHIFGVYQIDQVGVLYNRVVFDEPGFYEFNVVSDYLNAYGSVVSRTTYRVFVDVGHHMFWDDVDTKLWLNRLNLYTRISLSEPWSYPNPNSRLVGDVSLANVRTQENVCLFTIEVSGLVYINSCAKHRPQKDCYTCDNFHAICPEIIFRD